jgi:nucleoside-diphosphate-sugar epimerase
MKICITGASGFIGSVVDARRRCLDRHGAEIAVVASEVEPQLDGATRRYRR